MFDLFSKLSDANKKLIFIYLISLYNNYILKMGKDKISDKDKKKISQTMSWILRHGIDGLVLKIDGMGRIPLEVLMKLKQIKQLNVSDEIIRDIVDTSDKKRFRLDEVNGVWMIGANQGHSISIGNKIDNSKLMKKITQPVELCVHGTYSKFINSIKKTGLNRMGRTHIHFACGFPSDSNVISGARSSANVFIVIDMEKAMIDGIEFFSSSNDVILTEGFNGILEPKYFKDIIYK
jgi:RNA:NAD 2'-phosphotransferase (TPT1/KptA family)